MSIRYDFCVVCFVRPFANEMLVTALASAFGIGWMHFDFGDGK